MILALKYLVAAGYRVRILDSLQERVHPEGWRLEREQSKEAEAQRRAADEDEAKRKAAKEKRARLGLSIEDALPDSWDNISIFED